MLLAMLLSGPVTFGWLAYIRPYQRDQAVAQHVTDLKGSHGFETQGPSWLISLLGEERFQRLVWIRLKGQEINDEDIRFVSGASQLRSLTLS